MVMVMVTEFSEDQLNSEVYSLIFLQGIVGNTHMSFLYTKIICYYYYYDSLLIIGRSD